MKYIVAVWANRYAIKIILVLHAAGCELMDVAHQGSMLLAAPSFLLVFGSTPYWEKTCRQGTVRV